MRKRGLNREYKNKDQAADKSRLSYVLFSSFPIFSFLILVSSFFVLFSVIFSGTVSASVLPKVPNDLGLAAYYSFEDSTSTVLTDFSGNGNTGTLTNMTPASDWVSGRFSKGLDFDGTDDYVSIANSTTVNLTTFTVSAWVYMRSYGAAGKAYIRGIVGKYQSPSANGYTLRVGANGTSGGRDKLTLAAGGVISDSAAFPLNQWVFVTATHTGTTSVLYRNGAQVATGNVSPATNTDVLAIGTDYLAENRPWDGIIDEVRVYNRAMGATEVAAMYAKGSLRYKNPTDLGLIGYWKFDDATGTLATDSSASGNTGTLTNIATPPTATSGWTTNAKRGKALNFDGTDDYIGLSQNLSVTSAYTWSMWIKGTSAPGLSVISQPFVGSNSNDAFGFSWSHTSGAYKQAAYHLLSGGSSYAVAQLTSTLAANTWYYITGTWDGANIRIYLNGSLQATSVAASMTPVNSAARIGSHNTSPFEGSIDEVRVYNRALSAAEVLTVYQSGSYVLNAGQQDKLTNGLRALWSFNGPDINGLKVVDRSGQGNHANLTNGPTFDSGAIGQAGVFDGVNDYAISSAVLNTSSVTVSAWVKIAAFPSNKGLVAGFADGYGSTTHDKNLCIGTDGKVYFYVYDGATKTTSAPSATVPLNIWVHVAGTADGTIARAYMNGVEVGTVAAGATFTGYSLPNILVQGATGSVSFGGGLMAAYIDDVRIYARALSASEILQLYAMGK